jgi:hypothetical protein
MARQQQIDELLNALGKDKQKFLNATQSAVKNYISAQGSGCLTVVGLNSACEPTTTYEPSASITYARALLAFSRGKDFNSQPLDSGLTRPVAAIVVGEFEKLYGSNSAALEKALLHVLTEDSTILNSMVQTIVDSRLTDMALGQTRSFVASRLTKEVSQRACTLIVEHMKTYAHHSAAVGGHVTTVGKKAVTDVATVSLAKTVALVITKMIASGMGPLLAKLLATAAFKTAIMTALKKYIIAAIIATIIKAIAVKIGIASSTLIAWVLIPLIVAFIAREIYVFPGHLAEKVAEKLREELDGNFTAINKTILEKLFDGLGGMAVNNIAQDIAKNPEVIASIDDLIERLVEPSAELQPV